MNTTICSVNGFEKNSDAIHCWQGQHRNINVTCTCQCCTVVLTVDWCTSATQAQNAVASFK